jgi:hypothetical protein
MLYSTLSTASQAQGTCCTEHLAHAAAKGQGVNLILPLALLYSTLSTAAQSQGVNITLATMLYSTQSTASQA